MRLFYRIVGSNKQIGGGYGVPALSHLLRDLNLIISVLFLAGGIDQVSTFSCANIYYFEDYLYSFST